MRLMWLPQVLAAAGLAVNTYPGWEARGAETWGPLRGLVCHATAGSRTSTDAGEMRVLWETGSRSAPAPIAQCYLSRTGVWWVGASGRCNHVLIGDRGPHAGYGNSALIGVEAANDNRGELWPAGQLDAYIRGVAAICRYLGWDPFRVVGHREHQADKSDPVGIDMAAFRAALGTSSTEEGDTMSDQDVQRVTLLLARGYDDRGHPPAGTVLGDHLTGHTLADVEARLTAQIEALAAKVDALPGGPAAAGGVSAAELADALTAAALTLHGEP